MKYADLFLAPTSKLLLDAFVRHPKHGLLLSGVPGVGLGSIARAVACELVAHSSDIARLEPDEKGTIAIETIRQLYVSTRDIRHSNQVVIIDDADKMSDAAQNAFLKLLEEPTPHTFFILTSHEPQMLLPTILSRTNHIDIRPISEQESTAYLSTLGVGDDTTRAQSLFIASGLPAELWRLSQDDEYFKTRSATVVAARQLLQGKTIERLLLISKYTERNQALELLRTLELIVRFMVSKRTNTKLLSAVNQIEKTATRLSSNGHVRTQLMYLVLHLP